MTLIDEQYLKEPTYGNRRITTHLRRKGHRVNRIRVMRKLGIRAIY